MDKIAYGFFVLLMLLGPVTAATAGVSIGIGFPSVSIGINLPLFPELVPVPGYPVYYAPRVDANYFFYDGMYWVYRDDNWYASSWYNGPWGLVEPDVVPVFILRVPVSYYRQPPGYFRGWRSDAPPRWGEHWGRGWEHHRSGWDRWQRGSAPAPAPLPVYQRQYAGDRYPRVEQQRELRDRHYRYQPRDKVVRQHFSQPVGQQRAPAPQHRGKKDDTPVRGPRQQESGRPAQYQQNDPAASRTQQQRGSGENVPRSAPGQPSQQRGQWAHDKRQQPAAAQHEQRAPRAQGREGQQENPQGKGESQEHRRGQGEGQRNDEERGRGRN